MAVSMKSRVLIAVVGLLVAFVGWVAWSIEGEYGSGTLFVVETHQDGSAIVYDVDEQEGTRTPVFEGSQQEAVAFMERRRSEGRELPPTSVDHRCRRAAGGRGSGSAPQAAEARLTTAEPLPDVWRGLAGAAPGSRRAQ